MLQVEHIPECLYLGGVVIEHQQHAGEGEHDEEVERDSSHAPGEAVAYRIAVDLGRMQMQEDVRQHAQGAIPRGVVVLVTKDGGENLSLGRVLEKINLFLGLGRQVGLE